MFSVRVIEKKLIIFDTMKADPNGNDFIYSDSYLRNSLFLNSFFLFKVRSILFLTVY
jgi:hypothetical protein